MKAFCGILLLAAVLGGLPHRTQAERLTDEQLYFPPGTIAEDFYEQLLLPDLYANNTLTWPADGDPVIDTDVLPMLRNGEYGPGYVYSQADYYWTPNLDYYADLTGGTLRTTFLQPGLYHVRVTRHSSAQLIYAVNVQGGGGPGPEDQLTKDQKKIDVPDGDLFLILDNPGDGFIDAASRTLKKYGRQTDRFRGRQQLEDKIKALQGKKHVEIVTHGYVDANDPGRPFLYLDLGNGEKLDSSNAAEFARAIKAHVKYLTFVACNVGRGREGEAFLQSIADEVGKTSAWDCWIGSFYTYNPANGQTIDGIFAATKDGKYVTKTPEPASLLLLAIGGLGMLRRRAA